jgi:hypothetical protein
LLEHFIAHMRSPGRQLHFDFFGLGASPSDELELGAGLEVAGVLLVLDGEPVDFVAVFRPVVRVLFVPEVVLSSALGSSPGRAGRSDGAAGRGAAAAAGGGVGAATTGAGAAA